MIDEPPVDRRGQLPRPPEGTRTPRIDDSPSTTAEALEAIERVAHRELDRHGLTALGWTFRWDHARRRAGLCRWDRREISLSRHLFAIAANRDDALDTILHEIAHALVGRDAGHGAEWKRVASSIGATPVRCHTLDVPAATVAGSCDCSTPHLRVRMPARRAMRAYVCRRCGVRIEWRRITPPPNDEQ